MSIVCDMNSDLKLIEGELRFMHHRHGLSKASDSTEVKELAVDRRFACVEDDDVHGGIGRGEGWNSCSSSSSIGKNSDASVERSESDGDGDADDDGETEVQSSYNGSFASMEALEEVLPIRRGISSFYNGKSKSFASLADASSLSTMKHIAKPENAYSRKRRNLLAFDLGWGNKKRNFQSGFNSGGISKRPSNLSRSTLALAVAMSSSESLATTTSSDDSNSNSRSSPRLPPLHPQTVAQRSFAAYKSYSVADLRHCNKGEQEN